MLFLLLDQLLWKKILNYSSFSVYICTLVDAVSPTATVIHYFLHEVVSFIYCTLNEGIYKTTVLFNAFRLFPGRLCTKTKIYKV